MGCIIVDSCQPLTVQKFCTKIINISLSWTISHSHEFLNCRSLAAHKVPMFKFTTLPTDQEKNQIYQDIKRRDTHRHQIANKLSTYREKVDNQFSKLSKDTILKLQAIEDKINSDNPEMYSQALTTCRRLFENTAVEGINRYP